MMFNKQLIRGKNFRSITASFIFLILSFIGLVIFFQKMNLNLNKDQEVDYYYGIKEGEVKAEYRYFPVFNIYKVIKDKKEKILSIGKKDEFVHAMWYLKSRKIILINLESKLMLYDTVSKQSKYIIFPNKETASGGIVISPDEKLIALNLKSKEEYKIVVADLDSLKLNFLFKNPLNDENRGYYTSLEPVYWFEQNKIILQEVFIEGAGDHYVLNLLDNSKEKINFSEGAILPDGFRIVEADQLPPYGDCYPDENFEVVLYDFKNKIKTKLFSQKNTIFNIYMMNPNKNEFIYSAQKYTPDPKCKEFSGSGIEYYIYKVDTKKRSRIESLEGLWASWYPLKASFYNDLGIDIKKPNLDVYYLGK